MADATLERKLDIQRALKMKGITQGAIAAEVKLHPSIITEILNGTYRATTDVGRATKRRVLQLIAEKIDRPELFPELDESAA